MRPDQILTPSGLKSKPAWVDSARTLSDKDVDSFNNTQLSVPERFDFDMRNFTCSVVLEGDGDLVYQFVDVKHPDFRQLLADTIESHFGSTRNFSARYDTPVLSWGLLGKDVRLRPLYTQAQYIDAFVGLLDEVLEIEKTKGR
jgi:hypothetical protein